MAVACLVELVLVDNDARELVRLVLARAEDMVAAGEGGHLDPLGHRGRRHVKAGTECGGRSDGGVEDAARLRLARDSGLVVCWAGACELQINCATDSHVHVHVPRALVDCKRHEAARIHNLADVRVIYDAFCRDVVGAVRIGVHPQFNRGARALGVGGAEAFAVQVFHNESGAGTHPIPVPEQSSTAAGSAFMNVHCSTAPRAEDARIESMCVCVGDEIMRSR